MKPSRQLILKIVSAVALCAMLGAAFYVNTLHFKRPKQTETNFFFFYLSGKMLLRGENPYDQAQWTAGQDAFGEIWRPNKIFPYPLPLAIFTIPLGWLTLEHAFVAWEMATQILLAVIVFTLLGDWRTKPQRHLFLPILFFLLFFGPVYLSLEVGSIGTLALAALFATILLLDRKKSLLAGICLSLTLLKPPQGLTILVLAGVWLLIRRDWKAILGTIIGGLILLLAGMLLDPLWVFKFRTAGQAVLDRTMGFQSNTYSFAYLACRQNVPCMWTLGSIATILILGLGGYYLWRNSARLTNWQAFNLIIPLGFVSTLYLWSYDQLPYVIPITWIAAVLSEKTKSFVHPILFLFLLDLIAFTGLIIQAYTRKDLLSIFNTLIVAGICLWLTHWKGRPATI